MELNNVMSPTEVAKYCHVSLRLIYRQIHAGVIPHVRLGDKFLISRAALDKFLAGECKTGQPNAG